MGKGTGPLGVLCTGSDEVSYTKAPEHITRDSPAENNLVASKAKGSRRQCNQKRRTLGSDSTILP